MRASEEYSRARFDENKQACMFDCDQPEIQALSTLRATIIPVQRGGSHPGSARESNHPGSAREGNHPGAPVQPGKEIIPVQPGKAIIPVQPGKAIIPVQPGNIQV
jgi:hypothetical protein